MRPVCPQKRLLSRGRGSALQLSDARPEAGVELAGRKRGEGGRVLQVAREDGAHALDDEAGELLLGSLEYRGRFLLSLSADRAASGGS
jgi:hypothetical protein